MGHNRIGGGRFNPAFRAEAQAHGERRRRRQRERRDRENRITTLGEERAEANLTPATNNQGLTDILDEDFRPEFDRLQGDQADLEQRFLDQQAAPIDFEAFRGSLSALAESVTADLFGAGGGVERAQQAARGNTVRTGFGTGSGGLTNATQNIFSGARDEVANRISGAAVELSGQAVQDRGNTLNALGSFVSGQGSRLDSLRESLFGGQATIENLRLAEDQIKDNRLLLDESIRQGNAGGGVSGGISGAAGGALAGFAVGGPVGAAVGGAVGFIGGLF